MNMQRIEKEEAILLSLAKLDYLSRSQLQRMHNLKSDRNANHFLKSMSDYLCSFRDGENVYYLSAAGRERVGCEKVRKRTMQADHFLLRNQVYLAYGRPSTWKNEIKIEANGVCVVADAVFKQNSLFHFVEIDITQKMGENARKIARYRKLYAIKPFKLVFATTTEYRRKRLLKLCSGLDAAVYIREELK
ncbi:replication-relaxation family protein [Sporolactobacillus terrae]|uniref:replication-relaxation family protein n=1 Tax=Sporolactobacillus terrae TaxID=269673 RepID=UPI001E3BA84D|nr:replication-relaxation family protein [Sporolactobacillus terrae]